MKQVLFVCMGNSARSQMAEAFFNSITPKGWKASSAGTKPAERVSSKAVEVMRELGLDVSNKKPKLLTPMMVEGAKRIITMGCLDDESCPVFLLEEKSKIEDWKIPDPRGLPLEEYRGVRDMIRKKVEGLIANLGE